MTRNRKWFAVLIAAGAMLAVTQLGCAENDPAPANTGQAVTASTESVTPPACPHRGGLGGQPGCPGDGRCGCPNFVDADGDGICDHRADGQCPGRGGCGLAGSDGGMCPHRGGGCAAQGGACGMFVDADGDGVCDHHGQCGRHRGGCGRHGAQ